MESSELSKLFYFESVAGKTQFLHVLVPVKWSAEKQITIKVVGIDDCNLQLQCHARAFPWPHFQWMENDKDIDCSNGNALMISRSYVKFY